MDIYSLSIIFFELFSGKNPFPGNLYEVYQAKISDQKPNLPSNFPSDLKELVFQGFSKEPQERPSIEAFQSALDKMLLAEEQTESSQSVTLPELNSTKERNEVHIPQGVKLGIDINSEDNNARKQLSANLQAGNY